MPKRPGHNQTTLADVAKAAGLSTAAVSMALSGKRGVSEATRLRVVEIAVALGYKPEATAVRQPGPPKAIGLVIRAARGDALESNRFYAPVMEAIEACAQSHHIELMPTTMAVDDHYYPTEIPRMFTSRTCDGLIVVGARLSRPAADILRSGPPAVLVDAYADGHEFDSVSVDNIGGIRTAVEYLIAQGHRDIALLATDPEAFPSIVERRRGYGQAIAEAGLVPHYIDCTYWMHDAAATAGVAYIRAHPEVSAILCSHDLVAITLLSAAAAAGISIPEQVSVMGFDNIDVAWFASPPLTTLSVDKAGMGRMAVSLLAHRLEFPEGAAIEALVRTALVERRSIGPGPHSRSKAPLAAGKFQGR